MASASTTRHSRVSSTVPTATPACGVSRQATQIRAAPPGPRHSRRPAPTTFPLMPENHVQTRTASCPPLPPATLELMGLFDVPLAPQHQPRGQNPVDAITAILRAEGTPEPQHAACLVLESLAAALHARFGGSSATADWLIAAVNMRRSDDA